MESAPDALAVMGRDGRIVLVNRQTERLFGYDRHELIGQQVEILVPERLRGIHQRHRDDFDAAPRSRAMGAALDLWGRRKDGSEFPVEVSLSPISTDGELIIACAVRDITERKRAEEAQRLLAEAGAVLGSSLDYEATLSGIAGLAVPRLADWCAVDIAGEDGSIHRPALAATDPATEERVRELRRRYPHGADTSFGVARVIRSGEPVLITDVTEEHLRGQTVDEEHLRLLRALGMTSYLRVPLVARGRTLGAISLISAASGRRYGPADLALVQAIADRAALALDNALLHRQAEGALRIRDQFLSAITHDLGQPLAAMRGYAQMLRRKLPAAAAEAAWLVEGLEGIDQAVTKMTAMTGELVDLACLQAGRELDLTYGLVDLVALARREAAAHQTTSARHSIRVETAVETLVGAWDQVRLARVLSNLLSNAIKYSPNGGAVTITVKPHWDGGRGWAELAIRDEGIGIPAADLPRLFERFYRAGNTIGRFSGTGIGLSVSRQIVEQHGGTLAVESDEGSGTTVTVRLPRE